MKHGEYGYGLWTLVVISSAIDAATRLELASSRPVMESVEERELQPAPDNSPPVRADAS